MRKLMSWLLALLLLFAVAVPLQAADSNRGTDSSKSGTIKSKTHSWKKHRKARRNHKAPSRWSRTHHRDPA